MKQYVPHPIWKYYMILATDSNCFSIAGIDMHKCWFFLFIEKLIFNEKHVKHECISDQWLPVLQEMFSFTTGSPGKLIQDQVYKLVLCKNAIWPMM